MIWRYIIKTMKQRPVPDVTVYRIVPVDSDTAIRSFINQEEATKAIRQIAPNIAVFMEAYEVYSYPYHQVVHYSVPNLA